MLLNKNYKNFTRLHYTLGKEEIVESKKLGTPLNKICLGEKYGNNWVMEGTGFQRFKSCPNPNH